MGFLRSETMALYQLTIPKDDIWRVIESLGNINLAHFLDLNKGEQPFNLPYANQIRRCDETERRIMFLINKCKENRIMINKPKSVNVFMRNIAVIESDKKKGHDLLFDAIEEEVNKNEAFIREQIQAIQEMKEGISKLQDYQKVIAFVKQMLPQLQNAIPSNNSGVDDENNNGNDSDMLQFVSGTILETEKERMKKMLFRATRGMALTHFEEFEYQGELKCAYLVMFSGVGRYREKIQKICDTFMGQRFEIPNLNTLERVLEDNQNEIEKSEDIYKMSQAMLQSYLYDMNSATNNDQSNDVSTLEIYKWFVSKEKAIYTAINMMSQRQSTYIGFIWAPDTEESYIKEHLKQFITTEFNRWHTKEDSGMEPPTYFKSNDMIFAHQTIADMYNVASYREMNPAVFSIVTFPFLFSVMYGDWGHGFVFFVLGLVLTFAEPMLRENIAMQGLLKIRYFILMIGFFSCYNGLIYNEFFAISNDFFGTCYRSDIDPELVAADKSYNRLTYEKTSDCVYAFGMDPAWSLDPSNKLTFMNTAKEKISVIIAFFHLNFGIFCKLLNSFYFKKWKVLLFDVFTGFIIFFGFIGVMIVMIYVKWWYPVSALEPGQSCEMPTEDYSPNICTSPSVITVTINNFMGVLGTSTSPKLYWTSGQQTLANISLILAMICIPVMLCTIPCMVFCTPKHADQHVDQFDAVEPHNNEEKNSLINEEVQGSSMKEFENLLNAERRPQGGHGETFGDLFVWQMVETIEFVLGTISCTASYLRLWALSLAHGQLGEVFIQIFFQQLMMMSGSSLSEKSSGFVIIYLWILCFGYMSAVVGVLLGMDALEVVLHTVRLHWVEFMKQFFEGKGYPYVPFSFNEVFQKEMTRAD